MSAALSPDKKTLALGLQGTIWILPAKGGKAIAITDALWDCHEPAWSPDGTRIAFHSYRKGNWHIWTINKNGTELRQITQGIYDDREPVWSPDGRFIIFSSDRGGSYDLWRVDLTDNSIEALTTNGSNDYNPSISPDGESIAFVSDREDRGIYLLHDGIETLIAPSSPGARLAAPSWCPGGNMILYVSYSGEISQLFLLNLADKSQTLVSGSGEDIFPFRSSWLNDHTYLYTANGKIQKRKSGEEKLAFIPFEAEIILKRPSYARKQYDFDNRQNQTPLGIIGPVVSPDGNDVAFTALGDIYVQRVGGGISRITDGPHVDIDPDWSPDGKSLAYVSDRGGRMQIWIHDMATGDARLLPLEISDNSFSPAWSPDGKKIAFYTQGDLAGWGRVSLAIASTNSGEVRIISNSLFFPGKPSWSNDGNTIAFIASERYSTRYREGLNKFCLVSLQDETIRYVSPDSTRNPGMRIQNGPAWSPDGSSMAYNQDGVLWVVPVNGQGDITGTPRQITTELADKISWSGNSESLVYLALDGLKKVDVSTGNSIDIPVELQWKPRFPEGQYIIRAGRLFNGIDSTYLYNVDILIDGHRISDIVPRQDHGDAIILDASDKVVMPGLFESHTHCQVSDGEKLGKIWLSYGITSVRDVGSDPYDARERKESWSWGRRPGPRLFHSGALLDGSRVFYGLSSSITTRAHMNMELERAEKLDYSLIKTYVRMNDSIQREITVAAHEMGIPVSSHELYPAAAFNVDAVEHLAGTTRLGWGYSQRQSALYKIYDDVKQITVASGINITPTIVMGGFLKMANENPKLAENKQYNAFYSEDYIERWADRGASSNYFQVGEYEKTVKYLVESGVNVTAGTDSPFVPYGTSLHAELWLYVQAGLTPYRALQTATINAARAQGLDNDLGSVEPGKLADLVIVDGDPLYDISDAWNVDIVIKNGIKYTIDELLPGER